MAYLALAAVAVAVTAAILFTRKNPKMVWVIPPIAVFGVLIVLLTGCSPGNFPDEVLTIPNEEITAPSMSPPSNMLDLSQLSRKYSDKLQSRVEYINPTVCHPVIDILPDLKAIRCFGLSEEMPMDINLFENLDELIGYFSRKLDNPLNSKYIDTTCENCRSLFVGCNMECPRARLELPE